jgi:hypothetical protein
LSWAALYDEHVSAIDRAATEAGVDLAYCYIVGTSTDDTYGKLSRALTATKRRNVIRRMTDPTGVGYSRNADNRYDMHHLARTRQLWVDEVLECYPDISHLWSVDSDIIVDPQCLHHLLAAQVRMAGARVHLSEHNPNIYNVMTQWGRDNQPYRSGHEHAYADYLRKVPATWVGACVLYEQEVFTDLECAYYDDDVANTRPLRMEELSIVRHLRRIGDGPWWVPMAHTTHLMTPPA